jgi:hypothetical protein
MLITVSYALCLSVFIFKPVKKPFQAEIPQLPKKFCAQRREKTVTDLRKLLGLDHRWSTWHEFWAQKGKKTLYPNKSVEERFGSESRR